MGQYYHPVSIDRREHLYSHAYDNGLKLMEHSYIGNNFTETVCALLCEGGDWAGTRIVWAGDYANGEAGIKIDETQEEYSNLYDLCDYDGKAPEGLSANLVFKEVRPGQTRPDEFRYILNLDKKVYIDLDKVEGPENDLAIHPLPLLTCEGNGRGGGDYHGTLMGDVGSWARDRIMITDWLPGEEFEEVSFAFKEGRD